MERIIIIGCGGSGKSTLARRAIEEKLRRENLAEEQRILYVAMTRPKEKLILVSSMYHAETRLQRLAATATCPVSPEVVAAGKTFADWLLLPLLCRPEAAPLRAYADVAVDGVKSFDNKVWQVFIHNSDMYRERPFRMKISEEMAAKETVFDPSLLEFVYPYQRAAGLPAKVTATLLKGRLLDEEIAEHAAHVPYLRPLSQPRFRQERHGLTPAERGTATHLALQYLDFHDMNVAAQVEQLRIRGLLTEEQAEAVDAAALQRFLDSSLAEEIRQGKNLLREYRFTILMKAQVYDPSASEDDTILLQGVVDCCFETETGLTGVDFKTDRVWTEEETAQRAAQYRPQLEAYSLALERVLERPVTRRTLFFLHNGAAIGV